MKTKHFLLALFILALASYASAAPPTTTCTTNPDCSPRGPGFICNTSKVCEWQPPIGIPKPSFGIEETYRMYDDPAARNPDLNYNENAEGGFYTHYVDNTHSNATDTGNPYGTPDKPRRGIPSILSAGSVVEIHNSVAPSSTSSYVATNGEADKPIFVRGYSYNDKPILERSAVIKGPYTIWENLRFHNAGFSVRPHSGSTNVHHVALRSSEIFGDGTIGSGGGGAVWGNSASDLFHNVVFYNNHVHHGGDANAAEENDRVGFYTGEYSHDVWIVDNHVHHMGGDAFQCGHSANFTCSHIYVGRNVFHEDRENAVDIKQCNDVVVSQNTMYGYVPCSSASGMAVTIHYGPSRIWLLYNDIYDSQYGIVSSESYDLYLIGNVIHNISRMIEETYNDSSIWRAGMGIMWYRGANTWVVNNVIYNVITGIGARLLTLPQAAHISNNIISKLKPGEGGYHITTQEDNRVLESTYFNYNLIYQEDGESRIYWYRHHNLSSFQAATGQGGGSIEADPLFVDATNNNFHLRPTSPAIDTGIESDVYQRFYDLYGIDIRKDIEGRTRPQGSAWDIGAYEFASGTTECVDNAKLLDYISQWKQSQLTMIALMQKIGAWKTGTGC